MHTHTTHTQKAHKQRASETREDDIERKKGNRDAETSSLFCFHLPSFRVHAYSHLSQAKASII